MQIVNNPGLLLTFFIAITILLGISFFPEKGMFARWKRIRNLTGRVKIEDALKHIYNCELRKHPANVESTAGVLGISVSDATNLLAQMQMHHLVNLENDAWSLTSEGREYAVQIVRAHRLWERYLADKTGYTQTEWHSQSELQEHQLTPSQIEALADSLGNPSYDPHGDPIPTAKGEILAPEYISLSAFPAGQLAKIVHLEDEPDVVYRQLLDLGLHLGMLLKIEARDSEQIYLKINGADQTLSTVVAANISVLPAQAEEISAPKVSHPLSDLALGEQANVVGISPLSHGIERRRLMDLGIIPGTIIKAEMKSPSGDPTAYLIRGALIALRKEQAKAIQITPYLDVKAAHLSEVIQ